MTWETLLGLLKRPNLKEKETFRRPSRLEKVTIDNYRFRFLSQQGLFRHIVDKHASEIPKDSIFGPPPHLPPSSSPPAETDLAI